MRKRLLAVAAAGAVLALAACSTPAPEATDEAPTGSGEVTIGALTSLSGALSVAGITWLDGFHSGIDYATDGTGIINGTKIIVKDIDDASDPNVALTEATGLVTDGVQIITGTAASGIAIGLADFAKENDILYVSGSANSDSLTGVNENTFRGTRQAYMDIAATGELLGDNLKGANVVLLAHDIEYGKGQIAAFLAQFGNEPAKITQILAPFPTPDIAPYIQRVKDENPDILIPFLSGDTAPWYVAMQQQDILKNTEIATNTGTRSSWPTYQQIWSDNIHVFTPYPPGALDNDAAKFLDKAHPEADFHAADGFTAAMMIVHAIEVTKGEPDVAGMIKAIEGYKFDGPRGSTEVRAEDHALLAPYYSVSYETGKPVVLNQLKVVPPPLK